MDQPRGALTRWQPKSWVKGPSRISAGWIEIDRERATTYPLLWNPLLMVDFAAVRAEADVERFVRVHGLLRTGPDAPILRERSSEFLDEAATMARLLQVVLALRAAPKDSDAEKRLRQWIAGLPPLPDRGWSKTPAQLLEVASGLGLRVRPLRTPRSKTPEGTYSHAAQELASHINARMRATETVIEFAAGDGDARETGAFGFRQSPHDLLSAAYYQLATVLAMQVPLRPCEDCGRLFEVHDERMRFCADRCRQKKWRREHPKRGEED